MKKKIIISCIVLIFLLILIVVLYNYLEYKNNQKLIQNNTRYEEIKNDVNKEMKRYFSVTRPTCNVEQAVQKIPDGELIYNGGMDKEKFLDVDGKSYCDTITYATCVEKNKWEYKIYIRCKDYTDDEFVDWD
ncbi:MAG: hypothetical protein PHS24_02660 [Bacilli bacterium]|mgnify:CR=1 FL=1|nr:hypothetical protein [Bacilli bacterium]